MRDVFSGHREAPAASRGFFKSCKVRAFGSAVYVVLCDTDRADPCPYRVPLGFDYLCNHPNRDAIIAHTNRGAPARESGKQVTATEAPLLLTWNDSKSDKTVIGACLMIHDTRYVLETGLITIGRAPGNAIQITDFSVSWYHAELIRTPGSVLVTDLNSTNGTSVNGKRITDKTLLQDGDLLRFGSSDLCRYACSRQ